MTRPEEDVDWSQVRAVLSLRWTLLVRSHRGRVWRFVLTGFTWAMLLLGVAALTAFAWFAGTKLRADPEGALRARWVVHAAFHFAFVMLAAVPAIGLRTSDFLDVTKLFVFPVNHRTVFCASVLGAATAPGVFLTGLPLAALAISQADGPAERVGCALAAMATVAAGIVTGQMLLLLFLDLFRSRRWRDVSRIVVAVLSAGIYLSFRALGAGVAGRFAEIAESTAVWIDRLVLLPSWWGAHAASGSGWLRWIPALALVPYVVIVARVAAHVQRRVFFGEIEAARSDGGVVRRGWAGVVARAFRGPFADLVEKDVKVLLREPGLQIQILQQTMFLVVPLAMSLWRARSGGGRDEAGTIWFAGIAGISSLVVSALAMNPLGTEGAGIQHAMLLPIPRARILRAKSAAFLSVVGLAAAVLAGVAACLVSHVRLGETPGVVAVRGVCTGAETFAALCVVAGVGCVVGSWRPHRLVVRERRALRQTAGTRGGCIGWLIGLLALLAAAVLLVPIGLAMHLPVVAGRVGDPSPALVGGVLFSLAWGVAALAAGAWLGGRVLERSTETALEVLIAPDE